MTLTKMSIPRFVAMKVKGEPVAMVTAYDYPTAVFADRAEVDALLVGDSAAMTVLGHPNTLTIGMTEMLIFTRAVAQAVRRGFVIADLPFMAYQPSDKTAVLNAGALVSAGCDSVKCEGGRRVARRVRAMVDSGVAVMGHIGLTPQSLGQMGGYRIQGRSPDAIDLLCEDAVALAEAGAWSVIVEAMPPSAAAKVRDAIQIPVYGIGAGAGLDGQLLIVHDVLGLFVGDIAPRFAKKYASVGQTVERALTDYVREVRSGAFPGPEHCYGP